MTGLLAQSQALLAATPAATVLVVHADAATLLAREPALLDLLSLRERERLDQFLVPAPAALFGAARALLRCLLGARLGRPPGSLDFTFGRYEKPALAGADAPQFSISHAAGQVAVALGGDDALGVDIEQQGRQVDWRAIAPMVCSQAELALLESGGSALFLRMWTRKEAVAKALGLGLSAPLPHVDGIGPPGGGWSELRLQTDTGRAAVAVTALDGLPGLQAHLACVGDAAPLRVQRIA